ncbi:helix-turn-helix domain-containing protein [Streptomyces sp. PanSC9]|uniref:helix-turn-helix domain-containing protein n=1 Tax=Streptomyces sp. PanSC9 TaxID=1520461 RepID=UPI000FB61323|nr:helix-turn-helix domain-containing protein [Streptomyces sp. PanSC9]ROP51710.1 hypothetical protein EDD94_1140 [Streptomyces sp. PanSC9]
MANAFSRRVNRLNQRHGKTYQQMAADCGFERSVTWWNKMAWEQIEDPPRPALFPYLAKALEVPERRVAEMVAEQWCGVRPDDKVPERLRSLLLILRGVQEEDLSLIEQMADALSLKGTAQRDALALAEQVAELEPSDEAWAMVAAYDRDA